MADAVVVAAVAVQMVIVAAAAFDEMVVAAPEDAPMMVVVGPIGTIVGDSRTCFVTTEEIDLSVVGYPAFGFETDVMMVSQGQRQQVFALTIVAGTKCSG